MIRYILPNRIINKIKNNLNRLINREQMSDFINNSFSAYIERVLIDPMEDYFEGIIDNHPTTGKFFGWTFALIESAVYWVSSPIFVIEGIVYGIFHLLASAYEQRLHKEDLKDCGFTFFVGVLSLPFIIVALLYSYENYTRGVEKDLKRRYSPY